MQKKEREEKKRVSDFMSETAVKEREEEEGSPPFILAETPHMLNIYTNANAKDLCYTEVQRLTALRTPSLTYRTNKRTESSSSSSSSSRTDKAQ